ncbi:MAG: hypothetical protein JO069_16095 [Verrucomicrobia bacterium]|nr:hypothetical protein [Verrucomicrobiota bacterium]
MATPSFALVQILRETAGRLAGGAEYQWSHFGKCNCGHLAQTATRLSPAEIHRTAQRKLAEWSEVPDDFCPQTGVLIDRVIDTLFELGLTNTDLRHLEDLTDPEVLTRLPGGHRHLQRNRRADVVEYLCTWADLLTSQLPPPWDEEEPAGDDVTTDDRQRSPFIDAR